jgi:uncharacterized protein (TIGR03382 family)
VKGPRVRYGGHGFFVAASHGAKNQKNLVKTAILAWNMHRPTVDDNACNNETKNGKAKAHNRSILIGLYPSHRTGPGMLLPPLLVAERNGALFRPFLSGGRVSCRFEEVMYRQPVLFRFLLPGPQVRRTRSHGRSENRMRNTFLSTLRSGALACSALALCLILTRTATAQAALDTVAAGSDYFQTLPGTFANVPGIGFVSFMGNPIGPGSTDTIVQRQADADINGAPIPIQITALSLKSTAPVNIGGSFFDVFVNLDTSDQTVHNKGSMTINGTPAGGTFSSFFDVFYDVTATQVGNPSNTMTFTGVDGGNLSGSNIWNPVAPLNAVIVTGPFGDQNANMHTGLPANEVDFFPGSLGNVTVDVPGMSPVGVANFLVESVGPNDLLHHVAGLADTPPGILFVPEPGAGSLLAVFLLPAAGFLLRRRKAA